MATRLPIPVHDPKWKRVRRVVGVGALVLYALMGVLLVWSAFRGTWVQVAGPVPVEARIERGMLDVWALVTWNWSVDGVIEIWEVPRADFEWAFDMRVQRRQVRVVCPIIVLIVVLAPLALVAAKQMRVRGKARCRPCGYPLLDGNPICPECGTEHDLSQIAAASSSDANSDDSVPKDE